MTAARDVIGDFMEEIGVDEAYRAADRLIGRLQKHGSREGMAQVDETNFVGRGSDADLLRQVADYLEAENRILIGLWSTGFGNILDTCLQVITEPDRPAVPQEAP